jgi:hypothetical protein
MRRMVKAERKFGGRLALLLAFMCALVSIPALSGAAISAGSNAQPVMALAVTNNSSREIHHLYLSPVDRNVWGPDLLDGRVVRTGETFTTNDVSCGGNEIKVIAEDKDGCFLYAIVGCAQASTGWTITNDTPADCGN